MRSSLNCHIELASTVPFALPDKATGDGMAAVTQYPGTTKYLTVSEDVTFTTDGASYQYLLSVPANSTLVIDGDGTLKLSSARQPSKMWDTPAVLYIQGKCRIEGTVKLLGEVAAAKKTGTQTNGARAADVDAGELKVYGSPMLKGDLYQGKSNLVHIAAVTVRNAGQLYTYGGEFSVNMEYSQDLIGLNNYNTSSACGLYVYYDPNRTWNSSVANDINLSGGTFHGISMMRAGKETNGDDVLHLYRMLVEDAVVWNDNTNRYCELNDSYSPHSKGYIEYYYYEGSSKKTVKDYHRTFD